MNFALFLLLSTIENIDRKTLKGGEEKADWLGTLGFSELKICDLESLTSKSPNRSLLSLTKGSGKGSA